MVEIKSFLPHEDFECFEDQALQAFEGKTVLLTGGTGFIGSWILEAVRRSKNGPSRLFILTRDLGRIQETRPEWFEEPRFHFIEGDVRHMDAIPCVVDLVIHGAASASKVLNEESPLEMIDVIVRGTERILELARRGGAKRFLFLSSGLAYGRQSPDCPAISENQMGHLDALDPKAAYGNSKHFAEHLCLQYGFAKGIEVSIARLFAFVGPLLPLDAHFAVGNFIRDGLEGKAIRIQGDGTPRRTYLHAGELAHWIWTLLAKAQPGEAYNVGSNEVVSIQELAELVARECQVDVQIAGVPTPGQPPARYVPDIHKAEALGLIPKWTLEESIRRTLAWHRSRLSQRKQA